LQFISINVDILLCSIVTVTVVVVVVLL